MNDPKAFVVKLESDEKFKRVLAGVPVTCGMKSGLVLLKPDESVGEHRTESKEEAIIVLKGKADIYIEGKMQLQAEKYDLIYIPAETNHDIKNSSSSDLQYVYIVAPV